MSNKRILITIISALILEFFLSGLYLEQVLYSVMLVTFTAISGIIVYFLPKLKHNHSLKTQFILFITYILGGMVVIIFPSIYTVIAEMFLFLVVIIANNKKTIKSGTITQA